MAFIGDTCVKIGSPDWHIGDPLSYVPTITGIYPGTAQYGINATARIDASAAKSTDPLDDVLFYDWAIVTAPPKSLKKLTTESGGVEALIVLDEVGVYGVTLQVTGANGGCANMAYSMLVSQPFSAAYDSQQMYSVEWIWNMLPDFWRMLPQNDRLLVETLWRGVQQLSGADHLEMLNVKDNKSIATIQERSLKKWTRVDLRLDLEDIRYKLVDPRIQYQAEVITIENDFVSRVKITPPISMQRSVSSSGLLTSKRVLLLNDYNSQRFDSGKDVLIKLIDGREVRNTLGIPINIGTRTGFKLLNAVDLEGLQDFPAECNIRITTPTFNEIGLLGIGAEATPAFISRRLNNATELWVSGDRLIPWDDLKNFSYTFQIIVPDAENLGVSYNDVLCFEVRDGDNNFIELYGSVLGCVGDLVSVNITYTLDEAIELIVNKLEFKLPAEEIISLITEEVKANKWLNRYLDSWLTPEDYLEFGINGDHFRKFSINVKHIYRRSKIPAPTDAINLIKLTERTERFLIVEDTLITEGNIEKKVTREPLELYENLDFYLRRAKDFGTNLYAEVGSLNVFKSDRFDFLLAQVQPGDILDIAAGQGFGTYTIKSVTKNSVTVTSFAANEFSDALFEITPPPSRNQETDYLIFRDDVIPSDNVDILWSETGVFDNNDAVEANFGGLLKFSQLDWLKFGLSTSYRDVVIGLLLGRLLSPSVDMIELVTSIIAGVPFSPTKSRIEDIDPRYEIDSTGMGKITRILLEEVDKDGNRTQRFTSHQLPTNNDIRNPEYSGLSFNPATGKRYSTGDIINAFTSIGLGVAVNDLYDQSWLNTFDDVKDRHRFSVTIDVDSASIKNAETVQFIYDFIVEIKPIYTHFVLRLLKFLVDYIDIESEVFFKLRQRFFDNPYRLRGVANIFDDHVPDHMHRDESVHVPLTTWFPKDGELVNLDNGKFTLSSASGGFVSPENIQNFRLNHADQPWIQVNDFVFFREEESIYKIDSIDSDTQLTLVPHRVNNSDLPHLNDPKVDVWFYVGRYRQDKVVELTVLNMLPDESINFNLLGDSANDIAIGDTLVLKKDNVSSKRLQIINVDYDVATPKVQVYPAKAAIFNEECDVSIFREAITDRVLYEGDCQLLITHNIREHVFLKLDPIVPPLYLGIQPGDRLSIEDYSGIVTCVTKDNLIGVHPPIPAERQVLIQAQPGAPGIPRNRIEKVIIKRINTNAGSDDVDEHDYSISSSTMVRFGPYPINIIQGLVIVSQPPPIPEEAVLVPGQAQVGAPPPLVRQEFLRPGDLIYQEALSAYNHGEGVGVVRIISPVSDTLTPPNLIQYYSSLPVDTSLDVISCYILRQKPLSWNYFTSEGEMNVYPTNWGSEFRRV